MDVQCSIWNETYRPSVHDIQRPPWYKFRDASVIARRKWSARSSISIPKQENEKKEKNESEKINCYKCKSYLGPFQVFSSVIDCKLYPREHISGLELENIWKIFHLLVIGRSGPSPPQLSPSPGAAAINERSSFPGWYARPIRRPTFIKEARGSRVSFVQHRHPGIVTSPGRWSSARKPVPSSTGFLCRLSPFYEDTKRSWTPLSAFRAACTVFGIAVELILEAGPDLFPRSIFEMWEEDGERIDPLWRKKKARRKESDLEFFVLAFSL